jgi:hypothetical protein
VRSSNRGHMRLNRLSLRISALVGWSLPNLATGAGFRRGYALRTNDAPRKRASHAAFRPGQLGPVKAKFLADAAYNAGVKDLARSAERNFRLPP